MTLPGTMTITQQVDYSVFWVVESENNHTTHCILPTVFNNNILTMLQCTSSCCSAHHHLKLLLITFKIKVMSLVTLSFQTSSTTVTHALNCLKHHKL